MGGGNGGGGTKDEDAKHLLDSIGKKVHDEIVKNGGAEAYKDDLKGNLQKAVSTIPELAAFSDPCKLVEDYYKHPNGGGDRRERYPCTELSGKYVERFSDTLGGQCTNEKMRSGGIGACAPYRRLHLCHHNLENISDYDSNARHKLLLEVCMAAKYEGNSINTPYPPYQQTNEGTASQLCTVLARSFADIGDIVRGKDLFYGNTQEKKKREQLDENLKKIFRNIYDKLDGKNGKTLQERYQDATGNFFKLREDWWNNNREMVWYAITCGAAGGTYFRPTCGSGERTKDNCRCAIHGVPTYFDYVPQYLRWFEEWAEDFCRLRKRKLQNAKEQCRGKNGKDKYCSGNGYDCEQTIRGDEHFVEGECHKCSVVCTPFVKWLDNQKLEFLKQKKKYTSEIKKYRKEITSGGGASAGGSGKKRNTRGGSNYDGYEKNFYEQLKKSGYGTVDAFLGLLNNETTCTKNNEIEEGGQINFKNVNSGKHSSGDGNNKTFSRSKYCKACPWCGVNGTKGNWTDKTDETCGQGKDYNNYKKTEIPILTGDKRQLDIVRKYSKFCNSVNGKNVVTSGATGATGATAASGKNGEKSKNGNQMEKWECYYDENKNNKDGKKDINFCVLQNNETVTSKKNSMHYNAFFWKWVYHMLHDSLEWRKELDNCLKNENKKCIKLCHGKCDCFAKWVGQKKKEWEDIKKHFKTQKITGDVGDLMVWSHDVLLELLLKKEELLEIIEGTYGNAKETEHIKQLLNDKAAVADILGGGENKTTIDKLLEQELKEAEECIKKHKCQEPPPINPAGDRGVGRSEDFQQPTPSRNDESEEQEEDESEEEEEEEEDEDHGPDDGGSDGAEETATEELPGPPTPATTPGVNPCDIVATLFSDTTKFSDACTLKYRTKSHVGWKCISETTTKSGDTGSSGAICIPPRRQRLYVGKLHDWASGNTQVGGDSSQGDAASKDPKVELRTAFIQTAAIETFFLWDRYKKEWHHKNKAQNGLVGGLASTLDGGSVDGGEQTPEQQLQSGKIPPDFLRLMFYTLGDYKDILDGKNYILIDTKNGDKDIAEREKQIKDAIDKVFPNSGNKEHSGQPITRESWWENNAKHIWHGMVCALTYKETSGTAEGAKIKQNSGLKDKLLDNNNKPKNGNDYNSVKLEENSGTSPKTTQAPGTSDTPTLNNPKLKDFVEIPTFFRYLHEWGETFCRERKKRLELVKKGCRQKHDGGDTFCSGDGHDCTEKGERRHTNMFADLDCSDCHEKCTDYKKWIEKKLEEFHKQEKKYGKEFGQLNGNSSAGDNNCCEEIKKHTSASDFLKDLKHCKDAQNNSGEKGNELDFTNTKTTFGPLDYCKACPYNIVKCNSGRKSGTNGCNVNGNGETWEKVFEGISGNGEKTTINVEMVDRRGINIDKKFEQLFKESYLFKSVREQNWECKVINNDTDVCKLTNFDETIDLNDYTTFKVFLEYWLDDFLYGYYLLKKRKIIEKCTQKEGKTCNENSKNDCACVGKWVQQKGKEWESIKDHFQKRQYGNGHDMAYKVTSYFEKNENELRKWIDNYDVLKNNEEYEDCINDGTCGPNNKGIKKDMVSFLLSEIKEKIHNANGKPGEPQPNCDEIPPHSDETLEEQTDDDTTDNQSPAFCPPPPPPMTCVEEIAKKLREEAEGKINDELKGTALELNAKCNKVQKNDTPANGKNSCNFKTTYENSVKQITKICERIGMNRLKIDQEWNCKHIKDIGKHLCIPPRRKDMCLKGLSNIGKYNVNNSTDLLQKLQEIAQNEGDDIIKKLLEQNSCDEHRICDAMKYSFADLGDIIRGRDLLNKNRKEKGIQTRLGNAFENIYKNVHDNKKAQYGKEIPHYYKLRSDWWDANRRDIWKAMTCNAPHDAKFLKKDPNVSSGKLASSSNGIFSNDPKCRHLKDPPDYDYIPQPFRWMQEWSENFCILLNEQIKIFQKECEHCKNNALLCEDNENGKKCEKCKKQCENYNTLIHKSILEFDKYKDVYKEIYNDNSKISSEIYVKNFLEKLKDKCNEQNSADKYLDEASHCKKYKFSNVIDSNNNDNYAFKNPPKDFEQACKCDAPDPLDKCPNTEENKGACEKLSIENACKNKDFNNDDDSWTSVDVKDSKGKNHGVLVPPRRRHLCLRNITSNTKSINNKKIFKNELLKSAYSEGYYLWDKYKHDSTTLLDVMRYSFYDYGDIVKGTDMLDTTSSRQINKRLTELLNASKNGPANVGSWWRKNKTHVWNAMVCGYQTGNGYKPINAIWCSVPTHDEKTHQFMRWFREWTESFCIQRKKLYDIMVNNCNEARCDKITGKVDLYECTKACTEYENYVSKKKNEYFSQKQKYDKDFKDSYNNKDAPNYFKYSFYSNNLNCLFDNFNEKKKWENPYDSFDDTKNKEKCECIQLIIPTKRKEKEEPKEPVQPPKKPEVPPPPPPPPLPPSDEPFDPTILQTTIPFGVALALGSIAFLFLKKKTQAPVDLFSVINIPKSDYDIPTLKSSNRYIPYASDRYKGKTYIYMEGDSDEDKYAFMSDTTDITSSESEYEELDINDIYAPRAPKYKTLIEVVLEPSKRDTQKKPFITSIHDRNLYSGEEYSYNIHMSTNNVDIPMSDKNDVYSGIDLINDSLNSNNVDIYDELLKRKENELFGTNHPKHTNTHNVTKSSNSDPIDNQLDLFHTWLDRHRDMCEKWDKNNKVDILNKLKEEWENDNSNSGNKTSGNITPTSDIPSGKLSDIPSTNKMLNSDVSIQIHIDKPNQVDDNIYLDTYPDKYTVDNINPVDTHTNPNLVGNINPVDQNSNLTFPSNPNPAYDNIYIDHNNEDLPSKVQIEMSVKNGEMAKEK
ncbi:erythrocyte membrane protein 1 [Plasmodium falciparum RAJ116]|uniref:Erythrocyte membrane protein 1 n=1 Tax=Plasmodium falciparum RAJ116 TaxID=580058 RepID=A0A0L0CRQ3_PLAFA|nr:erythrocyte membrane protein 1 [Plasmodium falciparum RAJ116]